MLDSEPRVYVDQYPWNDGKWGGGGHMLANDIDALHAMADRIGLRRAWFQDDGTFPHYDLTRSKRRMAIAAGAIQIEIGEIPDDTLMRNRADGTYEQHHVRMARRNS